MVKIVVMVIMLLTFVFKAWMNYLKIKSADNAIPANVADVYDKERYEKWKAYDNERNRLSFFRQIANSVSSFVLIMLDVYALISKPWNESNVYVASIVVLVFNLVVYVLVNLPFDYYSTFTIEERFGFNKSTKKLFIADQLKDLLINIVLMSGLVCLFIVIHRAFGKWFVLPFVAILCVLILVFFVISPFFQKIYNRFTLLEDGTLKDRLVKLMSDNGCVVREIKVMDGSRRSSKANAYFTGVGKTKTIVLFDTLLNLMTEDEIVAVFAHEMGHNKHKDTLKGFASAAIECVIIAAIAYLLVTDVSVYAQFDLAGINYGFAYVLIDIAFDFISPLIGLIANGISCRFEYAADAYAVESGYGEALISALKKLAKDSLSNLSPNKIVVRLTYNHPPMSERIAAIRARLDQSQPQGK